jgi:hypothetical protein
MKEDLTPLQKEFLSKIESSFVTKDDLMKIFLEVSSQKVVQKSFLEELLRKVNVLSEDVKKVEVPKEKETVSETTDTILKNSNLKFIPINKEKESFKPLNKENEQIKPLNPYSSKPESFLVELSEDSMKKLVKLLKVDQLENLEKILSPETSKNIIEGGVIGTLLAGYGGKKVIDRFSPSARRVKELGKTGGLGRPVKSTGGVTESVKGLGKFAFAVKGGAIIKGVTLAGLITMFVGAFGGTLIRDFIDYFSKHMSPASNKAIMSIYDYYLMPFFQTFEGLLVDMGTLVAGAFPAIRNVVAKKDKAAQAIKEAKEAEAEKIRKAEEFKKSPAGLALKQEEEFKTIARSLKAEGNVSSFVDEGRTVEFLRRLKIESPDTYQKFYKTKYAPPEIPQKITIKPPEMDGGRIIEETGDVGRTVQKASIFSKIKNISFIKPMFDGVAALFRNKLISIPLKAVGASLPALGGIFNLYLAKEDFERGDKIGGTLRLLAAISSIGEYTPLAPIFWMASVGFGLLDDFISIVSSGDVETKQKFGGQFLNSLMEGQMLGSFIPTSLGGGITGSAISLFLNREKLRKPLEKIIPNENKNVIDKSKAFEENMNDIFNYNEENLLYNPSTKENKSKNPETKATLKPQASLNNTNNIFEEFLNYQINKENSINTFNSNLFDSLKETLLVAFEDLKNVSDNSSINIMAGSTSNGYTNPSRDPHEGNKSRYREHGVGVLLA